MNSVVLLWAAILVAAVIVAVAVAFLGRLLYVRQAKRSLVRLIGVREAVRAAADGLQRVLQHLLEADDEALEVFAADPLSEDRRALEELAARMGIVADELKSLPLPKRLWGVAEQIEQAAHEIATQAGGVGDSASPDAVLDALARIRMADIRAELAAADDRLQPLLEAFKVSDAAVYGGGLYI